MTKGTCTLGIGLALLLGLTVAGCGKRQTEPRILDVEGTVQRIELIERRTTDGAKGVVTVKVHSKRHEQDFERKVEVTDETEILINGALAQLADVKVGEKAVGTIRVEESGEQRRYVAQRVQIERAEKIVAPTTQASPPAGGKRQP